MERFGHKTTPNNRVKRRAERLADVFKGPIELRIGRALHDQDMRSIRHIIERELGDTPPSFQQNSELMTRLATELKVCGSLKRLE